MLTELDAINEMLSGAGLAPVASLDSQHPAVKQAVIRLDKVNIAVQSKGAWYNTSVVTLQPDSVTGNVLIPQNAVYANPEGIVGRRYTIRGRKIYDLQERTFRITSAMKYKIIEVLPFEDLPVTARTFIVARAVYEFFVNRGGQQPKLNEFKEQLFEAGVEYKKENARNSEWQQTTYRRIGPSNVNRHDRW